MAEGKINFVLTPEHKGLRYAPGEAHAEKRLFGTHGDPEGTNRQKLLCSTLFIILSFNSPQLLASHSYQGLFLIGPTDVDKPTDSELAKKSRSPAPKFRITGTLDTARCDVLRPLTGRVRSRCSVCSSHFRVSWILYFVRSEVLLQISVEESNTDVRAIELQLVRIESVSTLFPCFFFFLPKTRSVGENGQMATEATGIQTIQVHSYCVR